MTKYDSTYYGLCPEFIISPHYQIQEQSKTRVHVNGRVFGWLLFDSIGIKSEKVNHPLFHLQYPRHVFSGPINNPARFPSIRLADGITSCKKGTRHLFPLKTISFLCIVTF